MIKYFIIISLLFLANCLPSNGRFNNNCNLDNVNNVDSLKININEMKIIDSTNAIKGLVDKADKIMVENGYVLKDLKRSICFDNKHYYVLYDFINNKALGGGGSLVFDNKLKLIAKCFEE